MKYGDKEISELDDRVLIAAHHNCGQAQKLRDNASKHEKFNKDGWGTGNKKKLQFPPPNPNFTQMKNEIEAEMKKRKLI
jgi:hypothetical protein